MRILEKTWDTIKRLKWLVLTIGLLYLLSISAGMITYHVNSEFGSSFLKAQDDSSGEQLEKIFGRFRQPVHDGHIGTIALCALIIFTMNTLGNFLNFTLLGIFIVPIAVTLLFGGWTQGISMAGIQASSFMSLFLYLFILCLESVTYVIASVAGANIGLSVLIPKRHGVTSRWRAFKLAWSDAGRLYIVIAIILAVQAVLEILYVRKVLLMGGSGIPLMPY